MSEIFEQSEKQETATLIPTPEMTTSMELWSEAKRKDFVDVFGYRVRAAQYILYATADKLMQTAYRRKFISDRHMGQVTPDSGGNWTEKVAPDDLVLNAPSYSRYWTVGGRLVEELREVAKARADVVLKELPPLKAAVEIIDAPAAKLIEKVEQLKKKGQELKEQLDEVSQPIVVEDLDQTMPLGEFRALVKEAGKKRKRLMKAMDKVASQGQAAEDTIAKKLYMGLPGLTDAVIDVIKTHVDRAKSLSTMNRRVHEEILYGDCAQAMEMLQTFENDEPAVGETVRLEFAAALDKLRVSARTRVRKPRAKKKLALFGSRTTGKEGQ